MRSGLKFLDQDVQVIVVDVPDEADAFMIFETLNDRGLDLTIADLLKNYLFSLAGHHIEAVKTHWLAAVSTIETSHDERVFTTFLRHFWSSRVGLVRERDLYRSLKANIQSTPQAVEFVSHLHTASRLYAALLSSDHDYWSELGASVRDDVETLLRFGLEQFRPLLLAAMQYMPKKELRRVLRASIAWSV